MRDTTALRECRDCGVPMISGFQKKVRDLPEGHAYHGAHGYCTSCHGRRRYAGCGWDGPPPKIKAHWKAADLAAEWERLRVGRGCNRVEAAAILGVSPSTLTTAAWRARKYAERDAEIAAAEAEREARRAEIAAAEDEAHRINDDMIIYMIRKGRAA